MRTERLLLRPFAAGDADDLYAYLSDPEVVKFEPLAAQKTPALPPWCWTGA